MDPLEDKDIGPLWSEHYPLHQKNRASETLCFALCAIIKQRAAFGSPHGNWPHKIHKVLRAFGIPEDQFYEIDRELKDA